jgi:chitinase
MKKRVMMIGIFMFIMILSSCGQAQTLDEANVYINVGTEVLSFESNDFQATLSKNETYQLDIDLNEGVYFSDSFALYINDMLMSEDSYVITASKLTYDFESIDDVNPNLLMEVDVVFNLNGGELTKNDFIKVEPDQRLTIQTLNDGSGDTFTLVDNSRYSLRWFHKLFIKYNELYDAYEVVFMDAATNSVENFDLPDYDYVLALDNYFGDQDTLEAIESYTSETKDLRFVIFDQDVANYESGDMEVSFYTADMVGDHFSKQLVDQEELPTPIREEYRFIGWFNGDQEVLSYPGYTRVDNITEVTYEARWEAYSMTELNDYLQSLIPDETESSINLPTQYSSFEISWTSSDETVIDNQGVFNRPYQEKTITLTAHITSEDVNDTSTFDVVSIGYKSLDKPIASSYIYREYQAVDDAFFETLDVINTAFIIADDQGNLAGSNYLDKVSTYIMPKAEIYGNWVIMSIGPSSSWSSIASSPSALTNFANQIVLFINEYGFDGVDIDWETPTTAETKKFTALMKEVNEKVKANNPNHLVTAAIGGGMWQPPKYDLNFSAQYLDYINLMTYGATGSNGQYQNPLYRQTTYHNSTYLVGRTLSTASIDESVKDYKASYNIDYDKIIVGVAFYGMKQIKSGTSWVAAGSVYYHEIYNTYLNLSTYTEYYDQGAGVPYLLKNDGTEFISYDNPRSILQKSTYIIDEGLGGMMFWEYGTDTSGVLLQAMRTGLQK